MTMKMKTEHDELPADTGRPFLTDPRLRPAQPPSYQQVVGYVRVSPSLPKKDREQAIEHQKRHIETECKLSWGLQLAAIEFDLCDDTPFEQRPGGRAVLKMLSTGAADAMLVESLPVLSSDLWAAMAMVAEWVKNGLGIRFLRFYGMDAGGQANSYEVLTQMLTVEEILADVRAGLAGRLCHRDPRCQHRNHRVTKTRREPVHPGKVLLLEYMQPLRISQNGLGKAIGVPPTRINMITSGQRGISADTALRLARFFGTTPQFWTGLQADCDLAEAAERRLRKRPTDR